MKILDRYIVRTYVFSLAIVFAALMGLAVILDQFFNVNEFFKSTGEAQPAASWECQATLPELNSMQAACPPGFSTNTYT